jgi:aromatic ring-cleaving dioxygenase
VLGISNILFFDKIKKLFIQVPNLRRVIRHGVRLAIQQFDSIPGYIFPHNKPIYQLTIDGQKKLFTWQCISKNAINKREP